LTVFSRGAGAAAKIAQKSRKY